MGKANGQSYLARFLQPSHPALDPLPVWICAEPLRQKWMAMLLRVLLFLGFFLSLFASSSLWFFLGFVIGSVSLRLLLVRLVFVAVLPLL